MFDKRILRNSIWIILIALFGFSSVLNLFNRKDVIQEIGKEKIRTKDVFELGGRDEKSFREALMIMLQIAFVKNIFEEMGLSISDQKIENETKLMFSRNGKFDRNALIQHMNKHNITQSGLTKLVAHKLRRDQLFFPTTLISLPDKFVTKVHKGANRVRNAYTLFIPLDSFEPKQVLMYANLTQAELTDICLNDSSISNPECHVFLGEAPTEFTDLKTLQRKYKFERLILRKGKAESTLLGGQVDVINGYNKENYTTRTKELNGVKYFVYYEPIPTYEKIKDKLPYNSKVQKLALSKIRDSIFNRLNECTNSDDKIEFLSKYQLNGKKFNLLQSVSFEDVFQNSRCNKCNKPNKCRKCSINDCVCAKCFNSDNSFGITRPVAIALMLGELYSPYSYTTSTNLYITVPVYEEFTNNQAIKEVEQELKSQVANTSINCSWVDIEKSIIRLI